MDGAGGEPSVRGIGGRATQLSMEGPVRRPGC
jgi:hypothetical protein